MISKEEDDVDFPSGLKITINEREQMKTTPTTKNEKNNKNMNAKTTQCARTSTKWLISMWIRMT